MPYRLTYLQTTDITGPDASATVQLVDRDDLDRDAPPINFVVRLKAAEKQVLRDIVDRARLRAQRRTDQARAARAADPAARIDLQQPVANEDAP
jgi:hypothetical protein